MLPDAQASATLPQSSPGFATTTATQVAHTLANAFVDDPKAAGSSKASLSTASAKDLMAMRRAVQVLLDIELLIGQSITQCLDERQMVDQELEALIMVKN